MNTVGSFMVAHDGYVPAVLFLPKYHVTRLYSALRACLATYVHMDECDHLQKSFGPRSGPYTATRSIQRDRCTCDPHESDFFPF